MNEMHFGADTHCRRNTRNPQDARLGNLTSKRLRQTRLAKNGVRGVSARDSDRNGEISTGDRTAPDFMAASSLPDERTAGLSQQISQEAVERLRHSGRRGHRFAQGDDLDENRARFDVGVIVRREIEGHSGYFFSVRMVGESAAAGIRRNDRSTRTLRRPRSRRH
jgi:hypothetical protein